MLSGALQRRANKREDFFFVLTCLAWLSRSYAARTDEGYPGSRRTDLSSPYPPLLFRQHRQRPILPGFLSELSFFPPSSLQGSLSALPLLCFSSSFLDVENVMLDFQWRRPTRRLDPNFSARHGLAKGREKQLLRSRLDLDPGPGLGMGLA